MFAQGAQGAHFGAFPTAYNLLLDSFCSPGHKRSVAVTNISQFSIFFLSRRKDPINLIVKIFEKWQKTFYLFKHWPIYRLVLGCAWSKQVDEWPTNVWVMKNSLCWSKYCEEFFDYLRRQKVLVSKKFSDKQLCRVNSLCDWFKIMRKKLAHNNFAPVWLISCTQK